MGCLSERRDVLGDNVMEIMSHPENATKMVSVLRAFGFDMPEAAMR